MAKVLIFAEQNGNKLKKSTAELFTAAKGNDIEAVVLGSDLAEATKELGTYGAKKVYTVTHDLVKNYNSEAYALAVTDVIKKSGAQVVLGSGSMAAKDLFPRLAARLDGGFAGDCTEVQISGANVLVKRPIYAGKCTAQMNFTDKAKIKFVVMRPNQFPLPEKSAAAATAEAVTVAFGDLKIKVKDVVLGSSKQADLTEAAVIVSGGRGMRGPENFKLLEDLAKPIGATVGASRAVVDAGWVGHSLQVGQTGKTVAPNLYIACGISGAIQHLAGMSSSKVIVAINKDPEAPIFKKATYGIVGDVFEVLPKLTEEFKHLNS